MKIKIWYLAFLFVIAACADDGLGKTPVFGYIVLDGEAPLVNNETARASDATVKAYSSAQAWINGEAPIKTFITDSKGMYESEDVFSSSAVFYAESGAMNNWPVFLTAQLNNDPNIPDRYSGYATVLNTFMQDFVNASGKTFLISDVLVNGVSVFSSADACSKDNFVQLTKDAKILNNEGANLCSGKSQSQEHAIPMAMGKKGATETTINGVIVWGLSTTWPEVENMFYIKKDFTQIMFKVNNGNEYVTVYSLQN